MVTISGGTPQYEKRIREACSSFPAWYTRAARISSVEVTSRPEIREQIAQYEHGSRKLYVYPDVGDLLLKAIGHELAHGVDDNFGHPHFFTSTDAWMKIHRNQSSFDLQKYEQEPLEYFADMLVKYLLIGPEKLRTTNPYEVQYLDSYVVPVLQRQFGEVT